MAGIYGLRAIENTLVASRLLYWLDSFGSGIAKNNILFKSIFESVDNFQSKQTTLSYWIYPIQSSQRELRN
jgi:hypothetical protein